MIQQILQAAYGAVGVLGVLAYFPQLWELVRDTSGSKHVPLSTWALWGVQTAVVFVYVVLVVKDDTMILVTGLSAVACNACLVALVYNRFYRPVRYNRRQNDPHPPVA